MGSVQPRLGAEIAGGVDGLSRLDLLQATVFLISTLAIRGIDHTARHCGN